MKTYVHYFYEKYYVLDSEGYVLQTDYKEVTGLRVFDKYIIVKNTMGLFSYIHTDSYIDLEKALTLLKTN